ncbi:MAG: methyltransferase [Nitratireductor sp.]
MKNKPNFLDALILAFEREQIVLSNKSESTLFLNATPLPNAWGELIESFACEQAFRPTHNQLSDQNYSVQAMLSDDAIVQEYESALVVAGRVRKINELNLARAYMALKPGGTLVCAGEKSTGIQPLRKWVGERCEIIDSYSKYHGLVFTFKKSEAFDPAVWPTHNPEIEVDGYALKKGMFSADGPDKGSKLLIEHFDNRLRGKVADFGAGWGYLTNEALKVAPRIESVDLYEADYLSLEYAKQNISTQKPTTYNWVDLTQEFKKKPYDWVLMNPPFHGGLSGGRASEPNIGKRFIEVASSTLISGGRLLMVANRTLPYEEMLSHAFKRYSLLADKNGFKVYEAVK